MNLGNIYAQATVEVWKERIREKPSCYGEAIKALEKARDNVQAHKSVGDKNG